MEVFKIPAEPRPLPSVGSDDEESFVVLRTDSFDGEFLNSLKSDTSLSFPPLTCEKMNELQNIIKAVENASGELSSAVACSSEPTNLIPLASHFNSISDTSLNSRILNLLEQNEKLKDLIAQNNLRMRTQHTNINKWRQEVENISKAYTDKLTEAKSFIDKCKEENIKLAHDVEKYKNIKDLQDEEIIRLKEELKIKNGVYEPNSQNFKGVLANDGKVDALEETLAALTIQNRTISEENYRKTADFTELSNELSAKQAEVDHLKSKLAQIKTQASSSDYMRLQKENSDHARTTAELKRELCLKQSIISKAQHEMDLVNQRAENIEKAHTKEAAALRQQVQNLQAAYDPSLKEQAAQLMQQLMNAQMTITALEQEVKNKSKQVDDSRALLQQFEAKKDEIFALNEQLTLYKTDFEAEKVVQTSLKSERDQLAEDLANLHGRNQQLQEEVELMRDHGFVVTAPPLNRGTGQPNVVSQTDFPCPKCNFVFRTYQALENHVHRCLDSE